MYFVLILLMLLVSLFFVVSGIQQKKGWKALLGFGLAGFTFLFFWFLSFWGEVLWFEAVGYAGRFWRLVAARVLSALGGGVLALAAAWLLTFYAFPRYPLLRWLPRAAGLIWGVLWGWSNWRKILFFWYGVSGDAEDPILSRDVGFYLFKLPLLDQVYQLLIVLFILGIGTVILSLHVRWTRNNQLYWRLPDLSRHEESRQNRVLYWGLGAFFFLLAWGKYLDRFHLMYSDLGVVRGAGWTDVHVRLNAYYILIVLTAAAGAVLFVPAFRRKFREWMVRRQAPQKILSLTPALLTGFGTAVVWVTALWVLPLLFQWLYVQPNEISLEVPYIVHNIAMTRRGFDLADIRERRFPVAAALTREMVDDNRFLIENIRLWDWRALDQVYRQFQEIRLYYEFVDVDVDRYTYGGMYNQVMVSAREMQQRNLPAGSQTFVNTRFKYTHGFGITLTPVSRFTPQGLPDLLLIQGLIYAKYHMTDPVVFYNQEDLWVRATEKYYGQVQTVDPYYIMWEPPRTDRAEYILMFPFTPKNRQVLIGWIAGLCDPDGYGELMAYKFPKEKRVLGTQQMETKIDQDPILSERLTLWDQRGSRVIRGNVLVIPIDDTLLYVEPIYLQAETAAYPELRLVTLMHNDNLEYAPTFDQALSQLLGVAPPAEERPAEPAPPREGVTETVRRRIQRANEAFESYLRLLGERQYRRAGEQFEILERSLRGLMQEPAAEPESEPNQPQENTHEKN